MVWNLFGPKTVGCIIKSANIEEVERIRIFGMDEKTTVGGMYKAEVERRYSENASEKKIIRLLE